MLHTVRSFWQLRAIAGFLCVCAAAGTQAESSEQTGTRANASRWVGAGFGGAGNFIGIEFDRKQPRVVYALSDVAGVFRSTNSGGSWKMLNAGLGNREVSSFAVDPFDSKVLYAGVGALKESDYAGIYVSRNSGTTWTHLDQTSTNGMTFRKYRTADAIAPDPTQKGRILAGCREKGIWLTTDGGSTWSQVYAAPMTDARLFNDGTIEDDPKGPTHPAPVSVVVFDPANTSTVYAGLDGYGIVKSTQKGASGSWVNSSQGLPAKVSVRDLAAGSGGVLYAALNSGGVYRSTNGGSGWTNVTGSLPVRGNYVTSVAVHPTDSNIAYLVLATYDHANLWKTTDGGSTWSEMDSQSYDVTNNPTRVWAEGPTWSWQVRIDPNSPTRLFYVGYWGIFRSEDSGESNVERSAGALNTCVAGIAVDADHASGEPDILYAAHMDAGLLTSTNKGASWSMVFPTTYDENLAGHVWRIVISKAGSTKYFYATSDPWQRSYGQILRSPDGRTWKSVYTRPRPAGMWMGGAMLGLAVDPSQPSNLYMAQDGGKIYKSTNYGTSWAPTTSQPRATSFTYGLTVDAAGRVFAGTAWEGLWRSIDGGKSWSQVLDEFLTFYHVAASSDAVYASVGDDSNLYRSTDGGNAWEKLTNFTPLDDGDEVPMQGMAIALDPNDSNHIFFSRSDTWHSADTGAGVAESKDGGRTWQMVNSGLGLTSVQDMVVGSDGTVYAGTWCGSIWRRSK